MVMTLSFGFTLSFGALFSKTWRVYKIFSGARRNVKTAVKDRQLYFVIAGLLFVDIVILLAYMMISPFRLEDTQIVEKVSPTTFLMFFFVLVCGTSKRIEKKKEKKLFRVMILYCCSHVYLLLTENCQRLSL